MVQAGLPLREMKKRTWSKLRKRPGLRMRWLPRPGERCVDTVREPIAATRDNRQRTSAWRTSCKRGYDYITAVHARRTLAEGLFAQVLQQNATPSHCCIFAIQGKMRLSQLLRED